MYLLWLQKISMWIAKLALLLIETCDVWRCSRLRCLEYKLCGGFEGRAA
jgi:hypothetical protein